MLNSNSAWLVPSITPSRLHPPTHGKCSPQKESLSRTSICFWRRLKAPFKNSKWSLLPKWSVLLQRLSSSGREPMRCQRTRSSKLSSQSGILVIPPSPSRRLPCRVRWVASQCPCSVQKWLVPLSMKLWRSLEVSPLTSHLKERLVSLWQGLGTPSTLVSWLDSKSPHLSEPTRFTTRLIQVLALSK